MISLRTLIKQIVKVCRTDMLKFQFRIGTHEITLNLTLNFGNQNSVGYYTKNIQKGGKISFAIEFVYYIYIYQ